MSGLGPEELLQRELDGENTVEESAAIQKRLASDPGLRESYERLRRLHLALGRIGPADPPPGLAADVMRAVRSRAARAGGALGWLDSLRAPFVSRPAFGYALTLAAGILVGAVFVGFVAPPGLLARRDGPAAGTILPSERLAEPKPLDRQDLAAEGIRGDVVTKQADGRVVAEIRLESEAPLDVRLGFETGALSLLGFERSRLAPGEVRLAPGEVRIEGAGTGRYVVVLGVQGPSASRLRLSLEGKGVRVEKTLEAGTGS